MVSERNTSFDHGKMDQSEQFDYCKRDRRRFIQGCLAAAGTAVLGCRGVPTPTHNLFQAGLSAEGALGGEVNRNDDAQVPSYLDLEHSGELERRKQALWALLERCRLCPRRCGVNRLEGKKGVCDNAETFKVASFTPHFGEENPLVGKRGSGTIFFSHCNLLCVYCQNWEINHRGDGNPANHAELAGMMLFLQRMGCHNINLVTPTHLTPHIVSALRLAIANGLRLPLVYNSSGYDSLEVLRLLDGIIDIYLPDFKYQYAEIAARFSNGAPDYPLYAASAIKEMHRQVGVLRQTQNIAYSGLLIRHLVLPENAAGTDRFVKWVASELGTETHVNIMGQYTPKYRAHEYAPLSRRPTRDEMTQAMRWADEAGLRNFH